jgi:hypothetical protein
MSRVLSLAIPLLLLIVAPGILHGQEPLVLHRLTAPIQLDGLSDEPAWAEVPVLRPTMQTPTFGEAPSERTEFRVAYDDQYLYAAGRMYDSDPGGIRATSLRRDDAALSNDWFVIGLDTFNDKETTVSFGVNPAGVRNDAVLANDGQGPPNFDWNTFWDGAVRQTEEGWFAEIRIPLSSLRFEERDGRVVMGLSLWRRIARKNEMITYPAIAPRWGLLSAMKASQMQEVALEGIRRRNPVYVTPYLLGGAGRSHALSADRSAYLPTDQGVRELGLDLKYGVTSNLTLDLTYNTDFAQVEADEQQVNLTRFSLFFPEKRVFFQERASVFDFEMGGNDRLFYSRRIGMSAGVPVPIHGGARLVGRVGGWDVGLLDMQTAGFGALPTQNFGVARVRRQVLNGNSYLGAIVTGRHGTGIDNRAYGVDGLFRVAGQDYLTVNGAASGEGIAGTGEAFPDRSFLRARWERRGTDRLVYAFDLSRAGAAFNPEMGFLLRRDYTRLGDRISYGWRPGRESPILRHALTLKGSAYRRNRDGSLESLSAGPEWTVETKRGHGVTIGGVLTEEDLERPFRLSQGATVPAGQYRFQAAALSYSPPNGALLRTSAGVEAGSFFDGRQALARVSPTWNVSRHLELGGLYQWSRVDFPDRDQRFTAHVARLRSRVMLDTRLSAAGFLQYNSALDAVFANLRIRYNASEGNDLYLVYNAGVNTDPRGFQPLRPTMDNHLFLIKYARTFGLNF